MANVGNITATLELNTQGFHSNLSQAQKALERFSRNIAEIGSSLTALTAPLVAAGTLAAKVSMDFNRSMANVSTLVSASTEQVNMLKRSVMGLAEEFGKSPKDLAGGLYQVISAFGETADAMGILEIATKAATAGLSTTTDAVNMLAAVSKGYGDISTGMIKKISDLAFKTVVLGMTTFPELASSIGRVVPLASTLGVSLEELFAVMATGTGVTGDTAEVATQLRGILEAFLSPTEQMSNLMTKLGYTSGEAMIKNMGLAGALQAVARDTYETGQSIQDYLGRVEAITLALALTGNQASTFQYKLGEMRKATGATDKAFDKMANGINKTGFTFEQVKAKAEVLAIKFGDALSPALMDLMNNVVKPSIRLLERLVKAYDSLSPGVKRFVNSAALIVATLGPVLLFIGKLSKGIIALIGLFGGAGAAGGSGLAAGATATGTAFASLLGPIALVIGGITALSIVIWQLYKHNEGFRKGCDDLVKVLKSLGSYVYTFAVNASKNIVILWGNIKDRFSRIKDLFNDFMNNLRKSGISAVFSSFLKPPPGSGGSFVNWFKDIPKSISKTVGISLIGSVSIQGVIDEIQKKLGSIKEATIRLKPVLQLEGLAEAAQKTYDKIQKFLGNFWTFVLDILLLLGRLGFQGLQWLWGKIKEAYEFIGKLIGVVWDFIVDIAIAFGRWIQKGWEGAKVAYNRAKISILSWLSKLGLERVWDWIVDIAVALGKFIQGAWDAVKNAYITIKNTILDWLEKQGIDKVWDWIVDISVAFGKFIQGVWDTVKNAYVTVKTSILDWLGKQGIEKIWDWIVDISVAFGEFIQGAWDTVKTTYTTIKGTISDWLSKQGIDKVWDWIVDISLAFGKFVQGAWDTIKTTYATIKGTILNWIEKQGIEKVWDWIVDISLAFGKFVQGAWDTIKTTYATIKGTILNWIEKQGIEKVWDWIVDISLAFGKFVQGAWDTIKTTYATIKGTILNWIEKQGIEKVWDWIVDISLAFGKFVQGAWDTAKTTYTAIKNAIFTLLEQQGVERVFDWLVDVAIKFNQWVSSNWSNVQATYESKKNALLDWLEKQGLSRVFDWLVDIAIKFNQWVSKNWENAKTLYNTKKNALFNWLEKQGLDKVLDWLVDVAIKFNQWVSRNWENAKTAYETKKNAILAWLEKQGANKLWDWYVDIAIKINKFFFDFDWNTESDKVNDAIKDFWRKFITGFNKFFGTNIDVDTFEKPAQVSKVMTQDMIDAFQQSQRDIILTTAGTTLSVLGLWMGLSDKLVGHSVIPDMLNKIASFFRSRLLGVKDDNQKTYDEIVWIWENPRLKNTWTNTAGWFKRTWEDVKKWWNSLWEEEPAPKTPKPSPTTPSNKPLLPSRAWKPSTFEFPRLQEAYWRSLRMEYMANKMTELAKKEERELASIPIAFNLVDPTPQAEKYREQINRVMEEEAKFDVVRLNATPLIESVVDFIDRLSKEGLNDLYLNIQSFIDRLKNAFQFGLKEDMVNTLKEAFSYGKKWIKGVSGEMVEVYKTFEDKLNEVRQDAVTNLRNNINKLVDVIIAITDPATALAQMLSWLIEFSPIVKGILTTAETLGTFFNQFMSVTDVLGFFITITNKLISKFTFFDSFMEGVNKIIDPAIQTLLAPLRMAGEAFGQALLPVLKALFPAFKQVGIMALQVARIFANVWNALVTVANWFGAGLEYMDVTQFDQAIQNLTNLTWQEAEAVANVTEAMKQLTNVPEGFKVALKEFESAQPTNNTRFLSLATERAMSRSEAIYNEGDIIIENVTITSNNPEQIWNELKKVIVRERFNRTGVLSSPV